MANIKVLPQIKHVVMVMLENRSLDNVLGWLYNDKAKTRPKNVVPASSDPDYDGLEVGTYSNPLKPHFWDPVKNYPVKKGFGADGFFTPNLDPNEAYPHVLNQLFGNATTSVHTVPPSGTVAAMKGFLQDFDADDDTWDETLQIMETYTPEDLPVLNGLAKQYAVSDRWYSSMPTQTDPNRAYSVCGTSLGRLVNHNHAVEQYKTKTLWNALAGQNVDSAIFFHEIWHNSQCFTQYTFPEMDSIPSRLLSVEPIGDPNPSHPTGFYQRARAGSLPAFTYIEPKWGYGVSRHIGFHQGNDYHPPTDVRPGEALLANLYAALTANTSAWNQTLFIITFDEHGGTYDHHAPPWGATNPGDPLSKRSSFKFDLFGVRVPTILISPYIPEQTVFRSCKTVPYDHTSIIATLLKWQGIDPKSAGLWNRVANAPTFEGVLKSKICNSVIPLFPPEGATDLKTHLDNHLKGVPAGVGKYIVMRSQSIRDVDRLVAEYHMSVTSCDQS